MKKRIATGILLQSAILCVAPCLMGHKETLKTDVAAQENISTELITQFNNDTFGLEQLQAFSNKLESIFRQTEEMTTEVILELEIEDMTTNNQTASIDIKQYTEYDVPDTNGFKSYMPYTSITDRTSLQYKLQNNYAYTGNYGIRMVNDRYCVALGTAFNAEIGTYVDLILENGEIISCILSDIKADIHTEDNNMITAHNGCISEFIVDKWALSEEVRIAGNISKCKEEWDSKVVKVIVYEENIFEEE